MNISNSLNGCGLFGMAYNAKIERLGVHNGNVKGADRVGGLAGYGDKCIFSYCYNGASITVAAGGRGR